MKEQWSNDLPFLDDMKISQYVREYTSGVRVTYRGVWGEVKELLVEIVHLRPAGIKEEWEDVLHFSQLALYWRWGWDGEVWHCTRHSVAKFMARNVVWRQLYAYVGLPDSTPGFGGNYRKIEKVIRHLGAFGVSKERAEAAYHALVHE